MTDLTKMWAALARYQPYANADGHGESWRTMCEERTKDAAKAAAWAAADAAWEATGSAVDAAWSAADAVADWADIAIERIEKAIKEREPAPSNIEPTSNDDGQAQKMDAPEPLIHKHEWFHTGAMEYGVFRSGVWNYEVESPKRQPLTDAEIEELERWVEWKETGKPERIALALLVRRVEAMHGIGGDK